MSLRERIETLSRAELAGLIVVIVACVAGAAVWYLRSLPKPITVAEVPGAAVPAVPAGSPVAADPAAPLASGVPAPSAAGGSVFVDVTGHVRRPGVYEFPAGSRVIDAIDEAGGPRENAVLSMLNLAAVLTDGQQIVVPGPRDAVPSAAVGGVPGTSAAAPGAPGALININTADATALEALPGVGEVTAAAIVQHRTENGPFATVDQLEDVSGIGPATLEEIRPHATV
jgi:competence protein ComEA